MHFVVACDSSHDQVSPNNGKGKERAPLRPALATITPNSSPSSNVKRTPLGEKKVPQPSPSPEVSKSAEGEPTGFPSATIDVDSIGAVMAARLVVCLLGHVLFLKNQVPLPIAQLKRMTSGPRAVERRNKKMDKLLSSLDILSTQLVSSFTALASALSSSNSTAISAGRRLNSTKSHVAIILGPSATSMSAARARVVLEIDGLRVASEKATASSSNVYMGYAPNGGLKENVQSRVCKPLRSSPAPLTDGSSLRDVSGLSGPSDVNSGVELDESSIVEPPPDSDSEKDNSEASSDEDIDGAFDSSDKGDPVETEADIGTDERKLSRALAISNADPELGMAAETRPTQIHVLLRAPRHFSHPAWVPRQTLRRDMDPLLEEFVRKTDMDAGTGPLRDMPNSVAPFDRSSPKPARRRRPGQVKTDYVRVRSRDVVGSLDTDQASGLSAVGGQLDLSESVDEREEEQLEENVEDKGNGMIWWSWDGRLEGFAEL